MAHELKLGEKTYELVYTRRILYRLDRETGRTIKELFDDLQRGSYAAMVDLLWAGLLHAHPNLTPEDAAELLGFDDLQNAVEVISAAIRPVTGKADEDPTEQPTDDT